MNQGYDPVLEIDLRSRPRRRRREMPPLDSWTHAASPLEHALAAQAECRWVGSPDEVAECRAERWAEHLRACVNCAESEVAS